MIFFVLVKIDYKNVPLINRSNTFYSVKGNNVYDRFHQFEADKAYDVLVCGSSHAYRGYDPGIFESHGYDAYNLGSSGQNIRDTYRIVKSLSTKPKLLVIDLYTGSFKGDGVESASELITNVNSDNLAKEIAFASFDWRLSSIYMKRILEQDKEPIYLEDESERRGLYRGYVAKSDSVQTEIDYEKLGLVFKPNNFSFDYFIDFLDYLEDEKMNVVFITHPIPNKVSLNEMRSFDYIVRKLINNRFQYLNFALIPNLSFDPSNDFYDSHHLNKSGVKKFNELLITELKNSSLLP
ncbi:MAG: hypothetical protein MK105_18485 [Crocinitomicaceae bacterium]|nr:hypothetical protein [Crocinitomicaceae bacterium]